MNLLEHNACSQTTETNLCPFTALFLGPGFKEKISFGTGNAGCGKVRGHEKESAPSPTERAPSLQQART